MEVHHSLGTATDWIVMIVYFVAIMLFGSYFSKYNRTTTDFFFGGRRFAWWLIAMSIVATGVGSHSFIKYSAKGFEAGFSSTMTYMNDWFFVPFFIFGWLPIIVYTKIRSIPEYFEKRFSVLTRFLTTLLLLFYMIGYVGIGFLTMGKAILPLLPPEFTLLGIHFDVTLMGLIIVIALIVGVYITYGGQTAVIFTDLAQGLILIFAGMLVFVLGLDYLGGFGVFWNLLPTEWKLPLAHFNEPPGFNFVGIFWQDGVAGSVGFLFMNMGLVMRFMACKSVDEGRKAATFNILFMLPISAVVVGNAGWIGKAISIANPSVVPPDTIPDNIFVVVANVISYPGVFGFIMATLTAALMSTVDTLLNATAAIYINDIHRPVKKWLTKKVQSWKEEDKQELLSARIATVIFTFFGVLSVIPFSKFPTVYEAHGYFHSTLTPPLVTAIFLGVFWKKFTNAAVIGTLVGGVSLMVLGMYYPQPLIQIFDHGTAFDPKHPYTYIGALYNLFVCALFAVLSTLTTKQQLKLVQIIKKNAHHNFIMTSSVIISILIYLVIGFNLAPLPILLALTFIMVAMVVIASNYFIEYKHEEKTDGLTVWSLNKAKEYFKGSKINDREGEKIRIQWKLKDGEDDTVHFSKNDMKRMAAEIGDLVYISDVRKYFGGLKSVHSVYGEPHNEDGLVYIFKDHAAQGQFVEGRTLLAEKEM
ncbi:MAG: sodium:proline symporter [Ignavibacteria bacterium RIFOXYB2_FULL_35_12]|nr:MAG: sodium:proline symporter [Ignavibacteria bacterium GWA2_36_19]OGU62230.1 MAG: sodium:proline symporter [Ignavibacteria bacterium GWF2_35_20]OGU79817.1 MAG: sodium:proline symporter [Ignavibacteria bacterium RIFOXYA2_FULL_35_9]OGU84636.1 MAG: sodium:proline symporter [Ignavibacteria bacterium RIFOXYA12_FULL_35_25]OGU96906.1 MAG: sodium:proline symporter [Ignavibacteria bacterium RIFOXYB12_FULL_35_14]OGV00582.1 MAG: sodium:proline symporter [Ignavibacteria bacterium RIFOXYC2_FULL_35_16]